MKTTAIVALVAISLAAPARADRLSELIGYALRFEAATYSVCKSHDHKNAALFFGAINYLYGAYKQVGGRQEALADILGKYASVVVPEPNKNIGDKLRLEVRRSIHPRRADTFCNKAAAERSFAGATYLHTMIEYMKGEIEHRKLQPK